MRCLLQDFDFRFVDRSALNWAVRSFRITELFTAFSRVLVGVSESTKLAQIERTASPETLINQSRRFPTQSIITYGIKSVVDESSIPLIRMPIRARS